jgi:hypothetical protein
MKHYDNYIMVPNGLFGFILIFGFIQKIFLQIQKIFIAPSFCIHILSGTFSVGKIHIFCLLMNMDSLILLNRHQGANFGRIKKRISAIFIPSLKKCVNLCNLHSPPLKKCVFFEFIVRRFFGNRLEVLEFQSR